MELWDPMGKGRLENDQHSLDSLDSWWVLVGKLQIYVKKTKCWKWREPQLINFGKCREKSYALPCLCLANRISMGK